MAGYKHMSLADQVFEQLEYNILSGVYKRGEVISESRLSEELGVSRTPIREALNRLVEEYLVTDSPSGTVVLGVTDKDMADIYEIKRRIEPLAFAGVVENITDDEIKQLKEIVDQQEFYAAKEDIEKVRDLDTLFHDMIYKSCGSRVYEGVLSSLHHKMMKARKASLENEERLDDSVEEHISIYEAIASRNREKVDALVKHHLETAYHAFLSVKDNKE